MIGRYEFRYRKTLSILLSIVVLLVIAVIPANQAQALASSASAVSGWAQAAAPGFGNPANENIVRMSIYSDMLYVSTSPGGGEVWRTADGRDWGTGPVASGGFGDTNNSGILVGDSFNGYLYAGTENASTGGEIWRCASCDGSDWEKVVAGSLLGSAHNVVQRITVHGNALYAIVDSGDGIAVLRSTSGATGTWGQVNTDGFGDTNNINSWVAIDFDGYYYVGTVQGGSWSNDPTTATGTEVWRCSTCTGSDWAQVNVDGFGDTKNIAWSIASLGNSLYFSAYNVNYGSQIWQCSACDGSDWVRANLNGFGSASNWGADLVAYNGKLYASSFENWYVPNQGVEVYEYQGGTEWLSLSVHGWGNPNNGVALCGTDFKDNLYIGTANGGNGGEIWMYLDRKIYLPGIRK